MQYLIDNSSYVGIIYLVLLLIFGIRSFKGLDINRWEMQGGRNREYIRDFFVTLILTVLAIVAINYDQPLLWILIIPVGIWNVYQLYLDAELDAVPFKDNYYIQHVVIMTLFMIMGGIVAYSTFITKFL